MVSNSWGMYSRQWDLPANDPGRYADNPDHPFNLQVGALASAGADILFAAGNCGEESPDPRCDEWACTCINGANSHAQTLCVGGAVIDGRRVAYSSKGEGLLSKRKPDLCAETHFLGSEAFGRRTPDTGTSTSCPVAAGVVAALRTKTGPSQLSPARMRDALRTSARQPQGVARGWNRATGFGVLDAVAAADAVQRAPVMRRAKRKVVARAADEIEQKGFADPVIETMGPVRRRK